MSYDLRYSSNASSDAEFSSGAKLPRVLIIADNHSVEDFEPLANSVGVRLLAVVSTDKTLARLELQAGCEAILFYAEQPNADITKIFQQVEQIATSRGIALIVITSIDTLDSLDHHIEHPETQLLCAPDVTDLAAAIVFATRNKSISGQVRDGAQSNIEPRIAMLSEEVGRISRALEALTRNQGPSAITNPTSVSLDAPRARPAVTAPSIETTDEISATQVRNLIRARQLRSDIFPGDLFADPAWEILLDLLAARLENTRVSVSSLCIAAAVPPTTALRWIRILTDRGIVVRKADPQDGRRIFIALAESTAESLLYWFHSSRRFLCP